AFQVQARPNGTLVVMGSAASDEEKLAVSRTFRRLPGCVCVLNQLEVQPGHAKEANPAVAGVQRAPYTESTEPPPLPAAPRGTAKQPVASNSPPQPPRAAAPVHANAPLRPYVTEGTLLVPNQPAAPEPKAVPADTPTTRLMAGLKRRIEATCGK